MAHFAELDENNVVIRTIVVDNRFLLDELEKENEQKGIEYLERVYGPGLKWVQTSYNNNFRGAFGVKGSTYDEENDVFINPYKQFPSWIYSNEKHMWIPPVPVPSRGDWTWDEENLRLVRMYPPISVLPESEEFPAYIYANTVLVSANT